MLSSVQKISAGRMNRARADWDNPCPAFKSNRSPPLSSRKSPQIASGRDASATRPPDPPVATPSRPYLLPPPEAATRNLKRCLSLYSILHTRYSRIVCSTEPLSLSGIPRVPMPPCPRAPSEAHPAPQNGVSSTHPTRIFPFGRRVKCIVRCGPSLSGFTVIWLRRKTFWPSCRQTFGSG